MCDKTAMATDKVRISNAFLQKAFTLEDIERSLLPEMLVKSMCALARLFRSQADWTGAQQWMDEVAVEALAQAATPSLHAVATFVHMAYFDLFCDNLTRFWMIVGIASRSADFPPCLLSFRICID